MEKDLSDFTVFPETSTHSNYLLYNLGEEEDVL